MNYSNLPPAIFFVGGIEPFRDEAIEYAENLKKADINVDFKVFPGCFHAFEMMVPWSKSAKEARCFFKETLEKACITYFASQY